MKAYSQDLRERILRAVELGSPRTEIVQLFGISRATIKRYIKQQREEGHMHPKAIPGRPPKKRAQIEASVLPQLQAHADATLEQHCNLWEQMHGERVSRWTMSRAIKRLGWTRKKSRSGQQSATKRSGPAGRENASQLPTEDLVFIDECGSNIAPLALVCPCSPSGERARGNVPRNRGKNTRLLAALSLEGMGAALILEGSANTTAFELSIEQVLAPSLRSGQIVVMDPATGAQKRTGKTGDRSKRLSTSLRDLVTHLISPPLKKPSRSSKLLCVEQGREHEKRCKKRLARHYSPSRLRMRKAGSSIVISPA